MEQTAYHRARKIPFCDDILGEALFDTQQGRYYMRELGLWESVFKNILIHHKLMSTTFTYSKDTMSYEFINISDYLDSYVLILRDPLIRAHVGNAGNIQSPPLQGIVLGLVPRSYHCYIGQRGTCLLSKLRMYHLVLKIPPQILYLHTTMYLIWLNP